MLWLQWNYFFKVKGDKFDIIRYRKIAIGFQLTASMFLIVALQHKSREWDTVGSLRFFSFDIILNQRVDFNSFNKRKISLGVGSWTAGTVPGLPIMLVSIKTWKKINHALEMWWVVQVFRGPTVCVWNPAHMRCRLSIGSDGTRKCIHGDDNNNTITRV